MTRLAPRVLCSRAVSVAMPAHAVGTLDARASRLPPRLFVDRSYVPVLAALLRAISVRSRLGPNVDGVAGRIKEVSYYHRVTPAG